MKKRRSLSWKPRMGTNLATGVNTYCSPACGHRCTFDEYIVAKNKARKLADHMGGATAGWKPHVWENMGWHYHVVRGPLTLTAHKYTFGAVKYTCLLADEPQHTGCGAAIWTDRQSYSTPEAAVVRQLRLAKAVLRRLSRAVDLASGAPE